jgi:CrcB protein
MHINIKKNSFFLISIGAIPGALIRWQIDEMFLVNLIGCFFLGFFNSLVIAKRYKLTLGVGLCASLTTFSGLSYKLHNLLSQGMHKLFLFNSISIVLMGIVAIGLGHLFAEKLNDLIK